MKYQFKAEVKQVLDIVVHSLYTDKEIFIRELISNASDASEKLRFLKLSEDPNFDNQTLKISISSDEAQNTLTIEDFGIGMNEDEILQNLGTIAHSGSKAFLKSLKEADGKIPENVIGQFGVGFYSVFMVADLVDVYTKKDGQGFHWQCDGSDDFTLENFDKVEQGTKIVVKLKDEFKEFSSKDRIKSIVEKYSSYIEFPIFFAEEKLNTMQAIWLKSKSELSKEQYIEFFKFQSHTYQDPSDWMHFQTDAPLELNALIYTPSDNPERLGFGKNTCEVALYSKKVLIDPSPKKLFPDWMRFAVGVIDSSDIPLNISRESMQDSGLTMKIGKVVLKRFIKHLNEIALKDTQKYETIFKKFGYFLKEGAATDVDNRKELSKLLRFESSVFENNEKISLPDYVSRMKEDQKNIFYAAASNRQTIESGPYVQAFKSKGFEVIYLYEPIDSFLIANLHSFEDKNFKSIDDADIEELKSDDDNQTVLTGLKTWIKDSLGADKVSDVITGSRLVDSPVAVLNADSFTPQMRAMMKAMNPDADLPAPVVKFEINKNNQIIQNLDSLKDTNPDLAKLVLEQLYDNALLSAGMLENPRSMATRINQLLEKLSESKA